MLARAHPDALAGELASVEANRRLYRGNLTEASERLARAGVSPVLIKADTTGDCAYGNFDLVVGDDGWPAAVAALQPWAVRVSAHPLEPDKLLLHPSRGPAAHLHRHVAWFGIPVIDTAVLRRDASPAGDGPWLLPSPADQLRTLLAHALFQNLAIDLSELLAVRVLARAAAEAQQAARSEGWGRSFAVLWPLVSTTLLSLDRDGVVRLPMPVPLGPALFCGVEHAAHLARTGRPATSLRELLLRGPLIAAKRRRRA